MWVTGALRFNSLPQHPLVMREVSRHSHARHVEHLHGFIVAASTRHATPQRLREEFGRIHRAAQHLVDSRGM